MQNYLAGKLSAKEEYLFEKHINACPVCKDEFEGLQAMENPEKLPVVINELNNQIQEHIKKKNSTNFKFFLKIAATILILFGLTFFLSTYFYTAGKNYSEKENTSYEPEIQTPKEPFTKTKTIEKKNTAQEKLLEIKEKKPKLSLSKPQKQASKQNDIVIKENKTLPPDTNVSNYELDALAPEIAAEYSAPAPKKNSTAKFSRTKKTFAKKSKKQPDYLSLAVDAYEKKKYNEALGYLNQAENNKKNLEKTYYYFGITYMALKNYDKAEKYINKLLSDTTNIFYTEAAKIKIQIDSLKNN